MENFTKLTSQAVASWRLVLISLAALFVGGLRDVFATANVNDRGVTAGDRPKNETIELLAKGAGLDLKDIYWRVDRGLSPKQAVDVALQEKLEADIIVFTKKVEGKDDAELRALAEKKNVQVTPDFSRNQIIIAMVKAKADVDTGAAPAVEEPPPAAPPPSAPKKPAAKKPAAKK